MKDYKPVPNITDFTDKESSNTLKETIEANYRKVKQEILLLVDSEIQRITHNQPYPFSFLPSSASTDRAL